MDMSKKKVLIIDDDSSIRLIIENTLKQEFDVFPLLNGKDGFSYLEAGNFPDMIICDLIMPELNGFDFLKRIKNNEFFREIPVMILSAREWSEDKIKCFELGAEDYVIKPFNPHEIIARIKRRIEVREQFLNKIEYLSKSLNDKLTRERINYVSDYRQNKLQNTKVEFVKPYKTPFIKRTFDIFSASITLILLFPLLILVAIAIRIESKGKIIYKSKRVGANYKIFSFYKFRTMYSDADKRLRDLAYLNLYTAKNDSAELLVCPDCAKLPEGALCSPAYYCDGERICEKLAIKRKNAKKAFMKIHNDPRITKVGRLLRKSCIDELPQLFNVLRGDMSIVGNRPLPPYEADALTKSRWSRRFRTAAGITGLWQIKRHESGEEISEEKRFSLDYLYAMKNSFWGDIILMIRTIPIIFRSANE